MSNARQDVARWPWMIVEMASIVDGVGGVATMVQVRIMESTPR